MSGKGALTQVQSTVYLSITTEVAQVSPTTPWCNTLLSNYAKRISCVTADDMTGFDRLFGYLLVTLSAAGDISRSSGLSGPLSKDAEEEEEVARAASHQHPGFFTCQGDMTANREGRSLKTYEETDLLWITFLFSSTEQQAHTPKLNLLGPVYVTRLKPGKKTLNQLRPAMYGYAAQLIITVIIIFPSS